MAASYIKLFKLLLDKSIKKGELCRLAGISGTTLAKLSKGESVTTDILVRICEALDCDFADIMEMKFSDAPRPAAMMTDIPVSGRAGIQTGMPAGGRAGIQTGKSAGTKTGKSAGTKTGKSVGIPAGVQTGVPASIQNGIQAGMQTGIQAGIQTGIQAGIQPGIKAGGRDNSEIRFYSENKSGV
jgi:DNA-binding Xre family transcriptional regulator